MEFGVGPSENGGVHVSVETLTTIIGIVGVLASFGSAFVWLLRRMDARFDQFDAKLDTRIDGVETRLTERIDGVEARLTERIDGVETRLTERIDGVETRLTERIDGVETRLTAVEHGLVDVKIAIARLEGPPPRLLTAR
jgi:hypothetical protein